MTGNALIDLAISLAGIALLVGLARLVFGAVQPSLSLTSAADRLAFDEPDFEPVDWLIDANERAAIAVNQTGEIALVKAFGDGLATRRAVQGGLGCALEGPQLRLDPPDHTFGPVLLAAADESQAQQWAVRIAGEAAI